MASQTKVVDGTGAPDARAPHPAAAEAGVPDAGAVDPGAWRQIDWSAHLRTARVGGSSVSYVDYGQGEPTVLFVHGLGAQWRVWATNLPAVAAAHRTLAVDLPGFGASEVGQGDVSIRAFAQALADLCEQVDSGPVVVVGNSMGGFVAAELALIAPERVRALVLVDAAGMVPTRRERAVTVPFLRMVGLLGARIGASARTLAARPGLRQAALSLVVHDPRRLPADLTAWALLPSPGPSTRAALTASLSYLTHEWGTSLSAIQCPTLITWGEGDALIRVRHADEYAQRIAGSRVVRFPEAGHVPMIECPEQFNATLLGFLAEVDGDGSEAGRSPSRISREGRPDGP
ncbi:MAG: alpha/beta hydrolase [Actinomycetota bacterium]|nr:alpha/beta hydrolase [Actinomycetota bacterium]